MPTHDKNERHSRDRHHSEFTSIQNAARRVFQISLDSSRRVLQGRKVLHDSRSYRRYLCKREFWILLPGCARILYRQENWKHIAGSKRSSVQRKRG